MRLIDADALNDILEYMINEADIKSWEYVREPVVAHHYEMLKQQIEEILTGISGLPTIESAQPERLTGKWLLDENPHDGDCRCSGCLMAIDQLHERNHGLLNALTGGKWWTFYKFCPNCGADMREGEEG